MYIDNFIWLPDILDKLALNITSHKTRSRKCSSMSHNIVLLSHGIDQAKMSTQPTGRPMQAVT